MLCVLGVQNAEVFVHKQVEYWHKLTEEGKVLEKRVSDAKKERQTEAKNRIKK